MIDIQNGHKHCKRCDEYVHVTKFYVDGHTRDGLSVYCAPCLRRMKQEAYRKQREIIEAPMRDLARRMRAFSENLSSVLKEVQ